MWHWGIGEEGKKCHFESEVLFECHMPMFMAKILLEHMIRGKCFSNIGD